MEYWNKLFYEKRSSFSFAQINAVGIVNFGSLLPFREVDLYKNQRVAVKTVGSKFGN